MYCLDGATRRPTTRREMWIRAEKDGWGAKHVCKTWLVWWSYTLAQLSLVRGGRCSMSCGHELALWVEGEE